MPMRLDRIHVRGFRSLANVELRPGPITVLIGPNGSGKSNILAFLRMVARARTGSLRRFVGEAGGASNLLHYGPKRTPTLDFELEFTSDGDARTIYSARLGASANDGLVYLDEAVTATDSRAAILERIDLGSGHAESALADPAREFSGRTDRSVAEALARISDFHFHDTSTNAPLRSNARREDARYLRSNGSNLAAYLLALSLSQERTHQTAWRRIQRLVQRIAPSVAELRPAPIPFADRTHGAVRLDWVDDQGQSFGPHDLSDGTLRAIALVTALAQPRAALPSVIAIDEPELGLHPAAITLLTELVRTIAGSCQVVLATQSPALLDHFDPEEVVVCERTAGSTSLRRLDGNDLAAWLDDYRLSELFDKNVLGGRP